VGSLEVLATEGMTRAGGEVRERHLEGAADFRLEVVHLAGESVRRKKFSLRIRIQERPVDFFGLGTDDTMKADGVRGHDDYWFRLVASATALRKRTHTKGTRHGD
jgi:hypothetical protein